MVGKLRRTASWAIHDIYKVRAFQQQDDDIRRQANYFLYPSGPCSHCAWPSSNVRSSFWERRGGVGERALVRTARKVLSMKVRASQ